MRTATLSDVGAHVDRHPAEVAAGAQLGAVYRLLFARIQELQLSGASRRHVAMTIAAEAERIFDLVEPALGDYAVRGESE